MRALGADYSACRPPALSLPRLRRVRCERLIVEHFDIGDHVGRQSLVWQKAVNRRRLDNLNQQAAVDHAIPGAVEALANASESSARDHARASGLRPDSPEAQAEVDIARSAVFRHAVEGALDKGAHAVAIKLHERAKDKLVPGDAELLDRIIEDARESEIGRDYVARIAPLSLTINTSVEDLDKAEAEATAKNNADWKDNDSQRATNQHFIDIQFGEAKRQVEMDKARLARTVRDWLATPGADGLPQTDRPPIVTWARLTPEERKGVDTVLERNARGPMASQPYDNFMPAQARPSSNPIKDLEDAWARRQRRLGLAPRLPIPKGQDGPDNTLRAVPVDPKTPNRIKWKLDVPSPTGGIVVQRIIRRRDGREIEKYWEAWEIEEESAETTRSKSGEEYDDTFEVRKEISPENAPVGLQTEAEARFYEGVKMPADFQKRQVEGAGDLPASRKDPSLPLDHATEAVRRHWEVR